MNSRANREQPGFGTAAGLLESGGEAQHRGLTKQRYFNYAIEKPDDPTPNKQPLQTPARPRTRPKGGQGFRVVLGPRIAWRA